MKIMKTVRTLWQLYVIINWWWHTIVTVSLLSSLSSSVYYDIQLSQCSYCLHDNEDSKDTVTIVCHNKLMKIMKTVRTLTIVCHNKLMKIMKTVRTLWQLYVIINWWILWHTIVTVSLLSSLSSSVYYDIQLSQCPYSLHYLHQFIMTYNCHSVRTVFIIFISLLWHTIVTIINWWR
jgi:hypothetical protein